jgi:2-polyprenyl-3-methyl-5-hydroxy-6-metoxy-1,4-benzoquinol methylase
MVQIDYTGRDNLEVMQEAIKYNKYLMELILDYAKDGDLIVDFGAGCGTFSFPVASAGYCVTCVETDPVLAASLESQGMTVLSDLNQAEDESIDYIYALNVLEHIEDDTGVVALWYRKLRPGARLMVYVPAFQVLFSSMDRKVGHVRRYSKSELCQKLSGAGFEIEVSRYADSIGFFATLAYKLFGNVEGSINRRSLRFYDRWLFPLSRRLDAITHHVFGKNVYARAVKPKLAVAK